MNVEGFSEVVLSVSDAAAVAETYVSLSGWHEVCRGDVDPALHTLWPEAGITGAREVLIGPAGAESGFLRIVEFASPGPLMRPAGRPWDAGGHFDFDVRVVDCPAHYSNFEAFGWTGHSIPVEYRFGTSEVSEAVALDSNGISVAIIERLDDGFTDHPPKAQWSAPFNSAHYVRDFEAALSFYRDTLGFKIALDVTQTHEQTDGLNVLGLPPSIARDAPMRVVIASPSGTMHGAVEIIEIEGVTGRNLSQDCVAPNRGIESLRFPTTGLADFKSSLETQGLEIVAETSATLAPYGQIRIFAVNGPDGERLEFFEKVE